MALRDHDFSTLKGTLQFDASLAPLSWFRIGGPADLLFTPENEEDLVAFLKMLPRDVPILTIGLGSNLLIRDGGFRGAVIRLGKAFQTISIEDDCHVRAGAQAADVKVARIAAEAGLAGFSRRLAAAAPHPQDRARPALAPRRRSAGHPVTTAPRGGSQPRLFR